MTTANGTSIVTGLDITAYLIADAPRSIGFYRDVIGLVPTELSERGAEFEFADGSTFGVWVPDEAPKKGAAVMFAVPDCALAVAEMRGRGAQLSNPIDTGVCIMSMGEDPDGNGFIIHQRK